MKRGDMVVIRHSTKPAEFFIFHSRDKDIANVSTIEKNPKQVKVDYSLLRRVND
jgi:hypothetical protein